MVLADVTWMRSCDVDLAENLGAILYETGLGLAKVATRAEGPPTGPTDSYAKMRAKILGAGCPPSAGAVPGVLRDEAPRLLGSRQCAHNRLRRTRPAPGSDWHCHRRAPVVSTNGAVRGFSGTPVHNAGWRAMPGDPRQLPVGSVRDSANPA